MRSHSSWRLHFAFARQGYCLKLNFKSPTQGIFILYFNPWKLPWKIKADCGREKASPILARGFALKHPSLVITSYILWSWMRSGKGVWPMVSRCCSLDTARFFFFLFFFKQLLLEFCNSLHELFHVFEGMIVSFTEKKIQHSKWFVGKLQLHVGMVFLSKCPSFGEELQFFIQRPCSFIFRNLLRSSSSISESFPGNEWS